MRAESGETIKAWGAAWRSPRNRNKEVEALKADTNYTRPSSTFYLQALL